MPAPRAADERRQRSHTAILAAARAVLRAEGPAAVTHQRVAAAAGVGRATVYRHWPRPEQLLVDVVAGADLPPAADPRSPLRDWLAAELRRLADEPALPLVAAGAIAGRAVGPGPDGQPGPAPADRLAARLRAGVRQAVVSGELLPPVRPDAVPDAVPDEDAATDEVAALLLGPLLYRAAVQHAAVSDALIERLLDAVGRWTAPGGDG